MTLIPVTRATLGNKRLKTKSFFAFAAKLPFCEIVASEFAAAAASYPIFFLQKEGAFSPVTLMTLNGVDNLYVEADGGWSGGYVPAVFRSHPFVVQLNAENAPALFINNQSGLLSDSEGEPLFGTDEQSDRASPVGRALQTITQTDGQGITTRALIAKIAETGIIQPITLAVDPSEGGQPLSGLFAINEAALNALPDETIVAFRQAGALMLIYAHLVSLAQVSALKARGRFRLAMGATRKQ